MTLTNDTSQNFTYGYDAVNRLTSKAMPNGITTTYEYDGMSRMKRLKDATVSTTLFDRQYSYDNANRISGITEPARSRTFGYDDLDRLTSVTDTVNGNESYSFDAVGNRTASHRSSTYGYQSNNRLTSSDTATYGFDANGNLVTRSEGKDLWRYVWDGENRLSSASTRKYSVRYRYDALGRRVQRYAPGNRDASTKFTYDGMDVLMDDDNGTLTKYQNGPGIDNKLSVKQGTTTNYFVQDHLGSTDALTDASGTVVSSALYDSFGNPTNNLATRYQFTGREYDNFTGLMHYRARSYDPKLGRFISEDPIGFGGGDVNLYGYVWNSPVNFSDPLGLDGWGNDFADWLDDNIEFARRYYQPDVSDWWTNGVNNTVADVAHGTANWFRIGNGLAHAIYCEDNFYGKAAYIAMDVERAAGLFGAMAGPIAGRFPNKFLPEEYYATKYNAKAPGQGAPYSTYERFSPNGDLKQVTTYDRFGDRVNQYDLGAGTRHGEGYHTFEYGPENPRHWPGGGVRSPHIPY